MPVEPPDQFLILKAEIESHRRLAGYYIIKFANLSDLRFAGKPQEQLLDELFQWFDDQTWPPPEKRPQNQSWRDHVVSQTAARRHVIEVLEGGPPIGHLKPTISMEKAEGYFDRFDAIFEEPKEYFIGMGFGNPEYVFLHGVAIVSRDCAGLLWVVESD